MAAGGWAGWQFLAGPLVAGDYLPQGTAEEAVPWIAAAVGAVAGAIVSWPLNRVLGFFFRTFNQGFDLTARFYTWTVGRLLHVSVLVLIVYGGLLYLTYASFLQTPKGFIPTQDKGYLVVNLQLPDSASVSRTEKVMHKIEEIVRHTKGVKHTVAISGQSILLNANAPNFGAMYVMLDEFHHRLAPELSGDALAATLQAQLQDEIAEGVVNVLGAPPVEGLGTAGGFKIVIEDRGNLGLDALQGVADRMVVSGARRLSCETPSRAFAPGLPGYTWTSTARWPR